MKKLFILISLSILLTGCSYTNTKIPDNQSPTTIKQQNTSTIKHTNTEKPNNSITTKPTQIIKQTTSTIQQKKINLSQKNIKIDIDQPIVTTDKINNNIATTTKIVEKNTENIIEKTTFIIDGTTYTLPYLENNSVYDAMKRLSQSSSFSFKTKEFAGLGYFVYEINGKVQDNKNEIYWIYYINNKSAHIGISNYIIQKGDIIKWKYEKSNF